MSDLRADIYRDLYEQLNAEEQANRYSATQILDILGRYIQPISALDVGCGIGTWLAVLQGRGVKDLYGIEGPWLQQQNTVCDPSFLHVMDLEAGFDLGRRFDLVICLEVAEHISLKSSERFIASLANHSSAILFSAAIPFQGGHHHVNEQFLSYWISLFAARGFQALDIIRGEIWDDHQVLWWLRQNTILFAHHDIIKETQILKEVVEHQKSPISVVHPYVYIRRIKELLKQLEEFKRVKALLGQGGSFKSEVIGRGEIRLTKIKS
jgi:2-polyprenyl-3-methyl-5-hydroxy-6-metoxy-1,4-benzoquinol methylase